MTTKEIKIYEKPQMTVVRLNIDSVILAGSSDDYEELPFGGEDDSDGEIDCLEA